MIGHARRPWLALALLSSVFAAAPAVADTRPNILLVIGDDVGFPFYGFMDHPIVQTPVLDSLAAEGTVFPVAYTTSSLCRPSLPGILTGLHPKDFPLGKKTLATSAATIARLLGNAGYASLHTGKTWPGGGIRKGGGPEMELDYGFTAVDDIDPHVIGRGTLQPIFDFIDGSGAFDGVGPAPGQPWFIWYAPFIPHTPNHPPAWAQAPYAALDIKRQDKSYYGAMTQLDGTIGNILSFLETRGQKENTIVIYLSDNGGHLKRAKGRWSENGYRTPILVWDPRTPGSGMRTEMAHAVDILPTILDYAGVAMPAGPYDGLSLRAVAEQQPVAWRQYLVGHHAPKIGNGRPLRHVRSPEGLKLYLKCGAPPILYDVAAHPEEGDDNRLDPALYQAQVAAMTAALDAWWDPC